MDPVDMGPSTLIDSLSNRSSSALKSGRPEANKSQRSALEAHKEKIENSLRSNMRLHELVERVSTLESEVKSQSAHIKVLECKLQQMDRLLQDLNESNKPKTSATHKKLAWINLSNWWKSRPSIETLKQQKIYNDEACFDTNIELVVKHEAQKSVPRIVVDCCDLIEEKCVGSSLVEGVYRQCGNYNKIQTLRFKIDANDYESLRQSNVDIHTLTGLLKLFLREIKNPLISADEAKIFLGKPHIWLYAELTIKVDVIKRMILSLPEINRDTMDYLCAHLNRLTKNPPPGWVTAETLSISITPSIFHTVSRSEHMQDFKQLLSESEMFADCMKIMIKCHQRIFSVG